MNQHLPTKAKPSFKRRFHFYYDLETYEINAPQALVKPEVVRVKKRVREVPRQVVNAEVYGCGWTSITLKIEDDKRFYSPRPWEQHCHEYPDLVNVNNITSAAVSDTWIEFGKNCVELFCEKIVNKFFEEPKPYDIVYLHVFNASYDSHFFRPRFLKYLESRGAILKKTQSKLTDNIEISGEFRFELNEKICEVYIVDLWAFKKGAASLATYLKGLGITKERSIDYRKINLEFDSEGKPTRYYNGDTHKWEKFNFEVEYKYLYKDVVYLPLVQQEIYKYQYGTIKAVLEDFDIGEDKLNSSYRKLRGRYRTGAGFAKQCLGLRLYEEFKEDPWLLEYLENTGQLWALKKPEKIFDAVFRPATDEETYLKQRRGFLGGFVAGNSKALDIYKSNFPICYVDVNSMYPYVMTTPMPYGEMLDHMPSGPYMTWYAVKLAKGKEPQWKKEYSCINNTFLGDEFTKYLPVDGRFFMPKEVYNFMEKYCDHEVEIIDQYYQATTTILANYMRKAVSKKALYKDKDPLISEGFKLSANSTYGKLAEKKHMNSEKWDPESEMYVIDEDDRFNYIAAGTIVTWRSRLILMQKIVDLIGRGNTFLYCDTDSITFIDKGNGLELFDLHPTKLGAWKLERVGDSFVSNGKRKKYALFNTQERDLSKLPKLYRRPIEIATEHVGREKVATLKYAISGFSKDLLKGWSYDDIRFVYSARNNVVVERGKKLVKRDSVTRKQVFQWGYLQFNAPEGNQVRKPGYEAQGLIKMDENGNWKLHRGRTLIVGNEWHIHGT